MSPRVPSVLSADREIADEILELVERGSSPLAERVGATREQLARYVDAQRRGAEESAAPAEAPGELEAIVRRYGRPALFVRGDKVDVPTSQTWKERLAPFLPLVEPLLRCVGRVEVLGHPDHDWIGTAWVIGERTVVTNRHVGLVFAQGGPDTVRFRSFAGTPLGAQVDFLRERDNAATHVRTVESVLYLAPDDDAHADMAVLRLDSHAGLPEPFELSQVEPDGWVAAIGYPGWDGQRNDADVMARIFGDSYGVKRFAPGRIQSWGEDFTFHHDCSTLGGNSGSVLFDLSEGRAVGLHFAGTYGRRNFAVKASEIERVLGASHIAVAMPGPEPEGAEEAPRRRKPKPKRTADDPTRDPSWFAGGRDGYRPGFLGRGKEVEPPGLGAFAGDVAPVEGGGHVLAYHHFSVVLCKSRRTALFTAVNIDGRSLVRSKRGKDLWYFDPRVARDHQIGNAEAYSANPLDRGHLVRRLDPVWGDAAAEAEEDTFHYTNSSPQHEALNQKTWLALEDYVLDRTDAADLRACVFSGPVLKKNDPRYRKIRLPREFWKIAVAFDKESKALSAAGYLLSQAQAIAGLGEEAPFGPFRTYQVPIADIAAKTGLELAHLAAIDAWRGGEEAPGVRRRLIEGPDDMRFG
ncbi:MAG: DNA/RNA non-specific endonuclease [Myxococcales bacterium]|nr:DNA/RNA non-specific endonuclease [Myxococcales bacterium]